MDAFGLDTPRNFAALERILLAFLLEGRLAGKIVVLLLDEAQNIAVPNLDLLHRLSNLQTVEEQLLQIVLLAQPNFTNKLDQRPALRSRITGGTYLGPLSFDDAIEMLRHRIGVAGGDFDKVFLKETHKPLYNATQGICRDLCVCADAALVGAFARNSRVVNVDVLKEAIRDMSFKGWTK
jgi:general secretion pathway protein A